jgi:hypothetical protein
MLKIQSLGRPSILQEDCIPQKISLGHKHLAPGNRFAEKEGFLFGRF